MGMTKEQYFEFHQEFCDKMMSVTKAKNADYTGGAEDPFANFTNVRACGGGTPLQGFLFRMNDKFMRISSFVELGVLQVKDESVLDTLHDLANYSALMAGLIESMRRDEKATNATPLPPAPNATAFNKPGPLF